MPENFYQSHSWDDRILSPGLEFVMPVVIQHLIKEVREKGEWNPEHAVDKYLEDIGEKNKDLFSKFFRRMKKETENSSTGEKDAVSGDHIVRIAKEIGIGKKEVDRIRSEFKNAGIISPCSNRIKQGCLFFEINPSLLEK